MANAAKERRTVHFRGRVQGVGFRYTARSIAAGFDVTGYVQNLADGSVRAVVEGTAAEIEGFVEAVRAEMSGYVRDVQSESGTATGEFEEFEIRH
jgi:acylphosphatase